MAVILTVAQMLDSPVQYLQRRFADTVIQTANLGLVYVYGVLDGGTFTLSKWNNDILNFEEERRIYRYIDMGDVVVAAPRGGYVNTPWGCVRFFDKAGHQWTWGANGHRYSVDYLGNRGVVRHIPVTRLLAFLFLSYSTGSVVYPEQLKVEHPKIALNRRMVWNVRTDTVCTETNREVVPEQEPASCFSPDALRQLKEKLEIV